MSQPAVKPFRVQSIDLLRGFIIVVMTLDHVRDFIHRGAMSELPTDLETTTAVLFATRWITHICAPAFALTAGLGAWLWWRKGRSRMELSRFLVTRGLWLMVLELVIMRLAYYFSWSPQAPVLLLVLWSLGLSMVLLAALVWLPRAWLLALALAILGLHPLLEGVDARQFGSAAGLWHLIHQVGAFRLGEATVVTPYPLIPWVGIMALGFGLGPLFAQDATHRRLWLLVLASTALAGFVMLRLTNAYGDTAPWALQSSPVLTVMSFLNVTKYPASPAFLLMTLGLAFALFRACETWVAKDQAWTRPLLVLGRTPLFYYMLHFFIAHLAATLMALAVYGAEALGFIFIPYPSLGGPAGRFPADFGFDLWMVYLVWVGVVLACYPLCRWIDRLKTQRRHWVLRYL